MKIFDVYFLSLILTFIQNTVSMNIQDRRVKRSVFDMITSPEENGEIEQNSSKSQTKFTTFISTLGDDKKPITYQDLRSMFLRSRYEENKNTIKNPIIKDRFKKHFKTQREKKRKTRHTRRKKENVFINLSFLTKL